MYPLQLLLFVSTCFVPLKRRRNRKCEKGSPCCAGQASARTRAKDFYRVKTLLFWAFGSRPIRGVIEKQGSQAEPATFGVS